MTQPIRPHPGPWCSAARSAWLALLMLTGIGCALGPVKQQQVDERIAHEQDRDTHCTRNDACASASPLLDAGRHDTDRHRVLLLERGGDALRVRLHLARSAQHSIEVQTYIFADGASSELMMDELLAAARRGVRVRLLVDQLFSLDDSRHVAHLALQHRNFQIRFYNPTFREARTQAWEFAAGVLCCFSRFNQRMHNKLFSVDDTVAIIGGRNYRDSYFDLDPTFAYYDRELLVTGPVVTDMVASFDRFWRHRSSVPMARLHDVGRHLLREQERPAAPVTVAAGVRERLREWSAQSNDAELIRERFVQPLRHVASVQFVSDRPAKIRSRRPDANAVSIQIARLLHEARDEVLVQTPYLVIGRDSRRLYRQHREHTPELNVRVSTNSLAATDAIPVYALSYKYKKRYVRDLGFQVYEFRPDPADVAMMVEGAQPGQAPRASLHSKSLVIDRLTSLVGTHNFDPRSDRYNTESALIVRDRDFAEQLAGSIERDMALRNSWLVAKRERGPAPFYRLSRLVESISTALPVFDFWPFRYASNFELQPGCSPLQRDHPEFYACHRDVGNFPGETSVLKRLATRVLTAFGAPLLPIL